MQLVHTYIWILWDLLALAIFFRSVQKCAGKGFVSTIIGLVVYIAAALVASRTYSLIAQFLYDNVVRDAIRHALIRSLNDMMGGVNPSIDIVRSIPPALRLLIGLKGGALAEIPLTNAADMAEQIIDVAIKDPMTSILNSVSFLIVFTVIAQIVRYISRLFTKVNRVPVVGTLNMLAGGVVGVLEGVIKLLVGGFILRILIAVSGGVWWWLNAEVIQSTYIWRLFF